MIKLLTYITVLLMAIEALGIENLFSYKPTSTSKMPTQTAVKNSGGPNSAVKLAQRKLIEIEAQVIEVAESDLSNFGFDFNQNKADILDTFKYLVSNGSAKLLAKPRISALENEVAVIQIGDRIPYAVPAGKTSEQWTVQYLDTGVKLRIVSECEGDNIIVDVQPEVSHVSQWSSNLAGAFPIISTRESRTKVRVKNSEPIIIGGLLNEQKRSSTISLPILGDIPLVGGLFKHTIHDNLQTDIVFIVVPKIIK